MYILVIFIRRHGKPKRRSMPPLPGSAFRKRLLEAISGLTEMAFAAGGLKEPSPHLEMHYYESGVAEIR